MDRPKSPVVVEILRLFAERGHSEYGGESISQLEHALQAAHLARNSGADASLTTAALLHDIGHLLHDLAFDAPDQGIDDHHEGAGGRYLSRWFGPAVVQPVRMHVAAKRYLCSAEPEYFGRLSEPSIVSLRLQGGPMGADEMDDFRASPHFEAAVNLRRWDEAAKIPGMVVANIDAYIDDMEQAMVASSTQPRAT